VKVRLALAALVLASLAGCGGDNEARPASARTSQAPVFCGEYVASAKGNPSKTELDATAFTRNELTRLLKEDGIDLPAIANPAAAVERLKGDAVQLCDLQRERGARDVLAQVYAYAPKRYQS
jgi:hypothetical protein